MTPFIFAFEVRAIQDYLFETGRLRDVVGASAIVDSIVDRWFEEFVDEVLGKGVFRGPRFTILQKSSGRLFLIADEIDVRPLVRYWRLVVDSWAPGLEVTMAARRAKDDLGASIDDLKAALGHSRLRPISTLPEVAPIAYRAPRTGRAVVWTDSGVPEEGGAWAGRTYDRVTWSKECSRNALSAESTASARHASIVAKLFPSDSGKKPFPEFESEDLDAISAPVGMIALCHLDANNASSFFLAVRGALRDQNPEAAAPKLNRLSQEIKEATWVAASAAIRSVFQSWFDAPVAGRKIPFRPVVLGGDDFTFICRADHALPLSREYARRFTENTKLAIEAFVRREELDATSIPAAATGLTASGAVVFLKPHAPMSLAAATAEEWTKIAKSAGRAAERGRSGGSDRVPHGALSITSLNLEDRGLEAAAFTGDRYQFDFGPYFLDPPCGENQQTPSLEDLQKLAGTLPGLPRGAIADLIHLSPVSRNLALSRYKRMRLVIEQRFAGDPRSSPVAPFEGALKSLGCGADGDVPVFCRTKRLGSDYVLVTPLRDARMLSSFGLRADEREAAGTAEHKS